MTDETTQARPRARGTDAADAGAGGETAGDVFGQMGQELADALRREVEQLRTEMGQRAATAAKGTGLLAGAGAAGALAGGAALTLPIIALRRLIPSWMLALLVAGGAGALSAYLAGRGLAELGEAAPIDTDRLKETAKSAVAGS